LNVSPKEYFSKNFMDHRSYAMFSQCPMRRKVPD